MSSTILIPIKCLAEHCDNLTWYPYSKRGMYFFYFKPEEYDRLRMRIMRSREDIEKEIVRAIKCRICDEEMMAFVMKKASAMKFKKIAGNDAIMVPPGANRLPGEESKAFVPDIQLPSFPDFLEIEPDLRVDKVYSDLIDEINICYEAEANSSALVMLRKLLETLVIDLLRFKYDPLNKQEMYFSQSKGYFLPLKILVDRFEGIANEYASYGLKKGHLAAIKGFRKTGNDAAHNPVDFVTKKKMSSYKKNANHAVEILLRLNGIKRGLFDEKGQLKKK